MNNFYPYSPMYPQPAQTPQYIPKQEVVKVNGENGARALQIAPNSSALLLDENAPIVWLVITDGAGYKTVTPYSITPYQPEPPVDVKSLEERIRRLEEMLNGKSNTRNNKPKSTDGSDGTN